MRCSGHGRRRASAGHLWIARSAPMAQVQMAWLRRLSRELASPRPPEVTLPELDAAMVTVVEHSAPIDVHSGFPWVGRGGGGWSVAKCRPGSFDSGCRVPVYAAPLPQCMNVLAVAPRANTLLLGVDSSLHAYDLDPLTGVATKQVATIPVDGVGAAVTPSAVSAGTLGNPSERACPRRCERGPSC